MENAVVLKNVTKHFDDFIAVNDLSLEIRKGSIFGLLGPNGAGKTTTIRMIVDIIAPDSGEIRVLGEPVSSALQRRIGYLPEERGLYRFMTIGEQLLFFAKIKGVSKAEAKRRLDIWLKRFSLLRWKHKTPIELSKGMQQKVQFIGALLHDPDLLILDEPFTGLDPTAVSLLKEVILELRQQGKSIVFSTHQMEQVEQLCDDICLINKATRILGGPLREVKRAFGRKTIILDTAGVDGFLGDDLAVKVNHYPNYFEIRLKDGVDSQEVLRRALAAGVHVNRFELHEASLNDIFIDSV